MLPALLALLLLARPAEAQNLVQNGYFDQDLSGWELSVPPSAALEASWDPMDVDGAPDSGSARLQTLEAGRFGRQQCVPIAPSSDHLLEGWVFVPSGQTETSRARVRGVWYSRTDCDRDGVVVNLCPTPEGSVRSCRLIGSWTTLVGAWEPSSIEETSPPGVNSAAIVLEIENGAAGPFTAFFDDVTLVPEPSALVLRGAALAVLLGLSRASRRARPASGGSEGRPAAG